MNKIQFSLFLFIFPLFIFFFNVPFALANETINFGNTIDDVNSVYGAGLSTEKWAQQFTVTEDNSEASILIQLKKDGTPTDNLLVKIYEESGGVPGGSMLGSDSLDISTLTGTCTEIEFNITGLSFVAGNYWIEISRDGTADASNKPQICRDDGVNNYAYMYFSSIWNSTGNMMVGSISLSTPGGGGGSATSTSGYSLATTTDVQVFGQLSFYALCLFFISFIISIWTWKSFML